jgi:hypothetical protein
VANGDNTIADLVAELDNYLRPKALTVALGPSLTSTGVTGHRAGGIAVVSFLLTATAAIAGGATLLTVTSGGSPVGPPVLIYATALHVATGDVPLRLSVQTNGTITAQAGIANGAVIRGQVVYPVAGP